MYKPHVSFDEENNTTLEFWCRSRKITIYTKDNVLIKVWGLDTDKEMEDIDLLDHVKVREAFDWLYALI